MPALPLTVPDVVCVLDLDPMGRETTSDLQSLAQDVFHVLLEVLGSNLDDLTRGVDAESYLSGTVSALSGLERRIDAQLQQDDRVDASKTTISQDSDGTFRILIKIQVDATVLPLSFTYVPGEGLQLA